MAARFVKKINGKKLIMTHFSSRYRGDDFEFSMKIMWRFEHMARRITDLWGKNDVVAAWDHMCFPVRTKEDEDLIKLKEKAIRDSVDAVHDARDAELLRNLTVSNASKHVNFIPDDVISIN